MMALAWFLFLVNAFLATAAILLAWYRYKAAHKIMKDPKQPEKAESKIEYE